MYRDLRVRNSCKPTPVPRNHKAYVFFAPCLDSCVHKVILAPNFSIASRRLKEFNDEQGLDLFWSFVCEDDFEVAYLHDVPLRLQL